MRFPMAEMNSDLFKVGSLLSGGGNIHVWWWDVISIAEIDGAVYREVCL